MDACRVPTLTERNRLFASPAPAWARTRSVYHPLPAAIHSALVRHSAQDRPFQLVVPTRPQEVPIALFTATFCGQSSHAPRRPRHSALLGSPPLSLARGCRMAMSSHTHSASWKGRSPARRKPITGCTCSQFPAHCPSDERNGAPIQVGGHLDQLLPLLFPESCRGCDDRGEPGRRVNRSTFKAERYAARFAANTSSQQGLTASLAQWPAGGGQQAACMRIIEAGQYPSHTGIRNPHHSWQPQPTNVTRQRILRKTRTRKREPRASRLAAVALAAPE